MIGLLSQFLNTPGAAQTSEAWAATPHGRCVGALERRALDPLVDQVFGYYALQIGETHRNLLAASPINNQFRVGRSGRCQAQADLDSLPFAGSSVDLVVIGHALEQSARPEAVVREAYRVLRPEGQLLVIGFNPAGAYGMRYRFDLSGEYPWSGRFVYPGRVRDWLTVLGMTVRFGSYCAYAPASVAAEDSWLSQALESAGDRWFPLLGGVYMLQAIKRVPAMRGLRPAWSSKRAKLGERVPAGEAYIVDGADG